MINLKELSRDLILTAFMNNCYILRPNSSYYNLILQEAELKRKRKEQDENKLAERRASQKKKEEEEFTRIKELTDEEAASLQAKLDRF